MLTSDFDFNLPKELIAQHPLEERDQARMMVLSRTGDELRHSKVCDMPAFLRKGDLIVVNDTRVVPARIFGRRPDTGGRIEALLVEECANNEWDAFLKCSGKRRVGLILEFANGLLRGEVAGEGGPGPGRVRIRFREQDDVRGVLERSGVPPLPPYIKRNGRQRDEQSDRDRRNYQTMFASEPGAVAAPTAGLHFTPRLVQGLAEHNIRVVSVTLHVGPGTFRPVSADVVESHQMESERYVVGEETASAVRDTRASGGRVIAVGTTVVRTLESIVSDRGEVVAGEGRTALFIREPWEFMAVDGLLTNFHLPRSTLLMLVCAFAGRERILSAYATAVSLGYRFYSYGDCCLIV